LNASHEESYARNYKNAFGTMVFMYEKMARNEEGE